MTNLTSLTPGQAEQLHRLEAVWPEFGHSLQVLAAMGGGMGWRTVKGVEYLTRYTQENGRKKGQSLGRRSPETEERLREFTDTVLKARQIRKQEREGIVLACRLAKAHGIARLPGRFAETLDWFWYTDVVKRLTLFGGSALLAYEGQSNVLAPASLVKDDHLMFISRTSDWRLLGLEEIKEACDVDKTGVTVKIEDDRIAILSKDRETTLCEIIYPSMLFDRVEEAEDDTLAEALALPCFRGLTVSRDSRPIELTVPDPRTYTLLCRAFRGDVWAERAEFAGDLLACDTWGLEPRVVSDFSGADIESAAEPPRM